MTATHAPGWHLPAALSAALAEHIGGAATRAIEVADYLYAARQRADWLDVAPTDVLVDRRPVPVCASPGGGMWRNHNFDRRLDVIGGNRGRVYLWGCTEILVLPAVGDLDVEIAAGQQHGASDMPILRASMCDGLWYVTALDLRRDPFDALDRVVRYVQPRMQLRGAL